MNVWNQRKTGVLSLLRRAGPTLPLLPILLFSACDDGRKNSAGPAGVPPSESDPAPAEPLATATPTPDDFGDWEGEVFSAAAGAQLTELKHFLTGEPAESVWADGVSHGLSGFPTTPHGHSASFEVRKGAVGNAAQTTVQSALEALRGRFASARATSAEIKIVHVSLEAGLATTELHVHLADERLQINAVWDAKWSAGDEPVLQALETRAYEECERTGPGTFADSTGFVLGAGMPEVEQFSRGMDYWMARIETLFGIQVGGWHGVAVADVNGDGLEDVYFPDGGGLPNRLLVQQPDGTVRDFSRESGLAFLDHTYGALFADFDNDGDQDAALTVARGVLVLANDGAGRFTTRAAKLFPAADPYSLCAADYDQDGDLDLYVCCYTAHSAVVRHSFVARPVPYHDAENGGRNELLRNDGGFRFRNATKAAGLDANNRKYSYSGTWDDFDRDGDLDLYVANDFGSNHLYRNQLKESGQPVFQEVAEDAGVRDVAAGMSACWGDYDNDGQVDLYVGNMFSSAGNRIAFQDRFKAGQDAGTRALYQRHARGNSLFHNNGNGTFQDVSESSGTTMGRWAWSSLFADLDNDGWEDLLVANGFITQADPADL